MNYTISLRVNIVFGVNVNFCNKGIKILATFASLYTLYIQIEYIRLHSMTIRFTSKPSKNGITINNKTTIQAWNTSSTGNKLIFDINTNENKSIKMNNVQEKLMKALAGGHDCCTCDDKDNLFTLTEKDLKETKNRFVNKDINLFGDVKIKEFRYDEHYGIANITTFKGDVLRVDLLTEAEKRNGEDSSKGIFKSNIKPTANNPEIKKKQKEKPKKEIAVKPNGKDVSKTKQNSKKVTTPAFAQNKKKDVDAFLIALGNRESGGNYKIMNKYGYVGLYQVGEQALKDVGVYYETKNINYKNNDWKGYVKGGNKYGITCLWDFMHSPKKQKAVQIDFKKLHWQYLKNLNLTKYVGKTINGTYITQSGLLAGAHLVGPGGVRDFLSSNGKNDVKDANGTPVSSYIKKFAGYDIKEITKS